MTEKADVYSLGNIFYRFITNRQKYTTKTDEEKKKLVLSGHIPRIPSRFRHSEDPAIQALIHVMKRCLVFDPKKRASASEVAEYLEEALAKIESGDKEQHLQPAQV